MQRRLFDAVDATSLAVNAIPCDSTRTGFHNKAWGRRIAAHPRWLAGVVPNPNGVPHGRVRTTCMHNAHGVEPRWGSCHFRSPDLGCAVATATPGFIMRPRWGQSHGRSWFNPRHIVHRSARCTLRRFAGTLPEMSHACDVVPDPECTVSTIAHETG